MRKPYSLLQWSTLVLLLCCYAFASGHSLPVAGVSIQQQRVTGQVTDENGAGFPGVNVVVKGTTVGTTTDADGKYSLEVGDANITLVFSFVGYAVQEIVV